MYNRQKYDFDDKLEFIIRNEMSLLWISSMCKLRRISHKLSMKPFGLYSVCERFAGVYTSIKSTKIKISPIIIRVTLLIIRRKLFCIHCYVPAFYGSNFSSDGGRNYFLITELMITEQESYVARLWLEPTAP